MLEIKNTHGGIYLSAVDRVLGTVTNRGKMAEPDEAEFDRRMRRSGHGAVRVISCRTGVSPLRLCSNQPIPSSATFSRRCSRKTVLALVFISTVAQNYLCWDALAFKPDDIIDLTWLGITVNWAKGSPACNEPSCGTRLGEPCRK